MKLQEVNFKKPVKVFQIFRKISEYDKSMRSFEERKEGFAWCDIQSKSGYVKDGELFLPEQILANPNLMNCEMITMEDDNCSNAFSREAKPYNHCFQLSRPKELDIFKIIYKEGIELYLQFGYFEVGIPERENFKICTLEKNKPVEIKINGKTDFSMSSRRARVFKEQEYVFDYIGDFNSCRILKEPYSSYPKRVPETRRVVDLLKPLW